MVCQIAISRTVNGDAQHTHERSLLKIEFILHAVFYFVVETQTGHDMVRGALPQINLNGRRTAKVSNEVR